MLLLLTIACHHASNDKDNGHHPSDDSDTDDSIVDTDTGIIADTGPTDPTCTQPWPDRTVALTATCPPPPADWALHELWSFSDDAFNATAHAGRFEDTDGDGLITAGDAMSLWIAPYSLDGTATLPFLLDGATGALLREDAAYTDGRMMIARTADFDPTRLGMEVATSVYVRSDASYFAAADASSTYDWTPYSENGLGVPWFVDLDGDGAPEVLVGPYVLDPTDGTVLRLLDPDSNATHSVAADLDRDGVPEIVTTTGDGGVGIWSGTGAEPARCPIADSSYALLAIGNLDSDDDGEIVVAGDGLLAICEADGTLDAHVERTSPSGSVVGIGELDGDPEPEIVLEYSAVIDGAVHVGIAAYDTEFAELWHFEVVDGVGYWNPFTLADLDGDGRHEIIVHEGHALTILDGSGAVLATTPATSHGNLWMDVPLVVDVDGDDLAEIVLSGQDPTVQVFENASGGWLVDEAGVPAPGVDQHPGMLRVDGTVPSPAEAFWTDPRRNVWQGHAAGAPARPDLAVSVEAVCAESCDADYVVTVYVANTGAADVGEPISVALERIGDGASLGSVTVAAGLPSGVSRAVDLRVAVDQAVGGLRVTVDPVAAIAECDETNNTAEWDTMPCP